MAAPLAKMEAALRCMNLRTNDVNWQTAHQKIIYTLLRNNEVAFQQVLDFCESKLPRLDLPIKMLGTYGTDE